LDGRREQFLTLAARDAVPVTYALREFAVAGGLISYGASFPAIFSQAGITPERSSRAPNQPICRSNKPTKFELAVISDRQGAWPDDPAVDPPVPTR